MSKKGSRQSLAELEALDLDFDIGEFPIGLGCALDLFREKDEVTEILQSLPEITRSLAPAAIEATWENYSKIIDRYQEQPHLLDRHLENMIEILLAQFRSSSTPEKTVLKHLSLKFLRQLFKVRGPKEVAKRMPHEIADLVPVLTYLENENLDDPTYWESGYCLVMWLSILVINPFHLKLLDGQEEEKVGGLTIAERLLKVCKKCIVLNNKVGQAAPFLIARFLTRPDMQEKYMAEFLDWACNSLYDSKPFGTRVGAFAALSAIFKHAKRQEVINYGEKVLNAVLGCKYEKCDTVLRKAGAKLIQRIGMMFMKTKIAPWRYQRGCRSLLNNLKGETSLPETTGGLGKDEENYDELNQFSSAIESVIDKLLESLKDKDTIVRWSAAKGIGRVTNRLPKDFADEVVEGILQNFSPREGHAAWHGGCLAVAELARRGLLLPERIPTVIPLIKKAIFYDEIRGNFSLGAHVRDAACYALWAFARAFEPTIIEPFVHDISTSLILAMLFDREINCRRAASAAFQENVGRQGNFPYGIDIVTVADFFAVGVRTNAYTKVSIEVAQFKVYNQAMIEHLLELKYNHFDDSVRELSAEALGLLSAIEPEYIKDVVIPRLIPLCTSTDTFTSHGAILCVGRILVNLKKTGLLQLEQPILQGIRDIVPTITERKFSGSARGNELSRQALNTFIDCCSLAKMPYHNDDVFIDSCQSLLRANLSILDNETRTSAGKSFANFMLEYYFFNPTKRVLLKSVGEILCQNLSSSTMVTRQGYAYTIGRTPAKILKETFTEIVDALLKCADITPNTLLWAESRRDAIDALYSIFQQKPLVRNSLWEDGVPLEAFDIERVFQCLMTGIEDYSTDKRGDIGSWVRKASMSTMKVFIIRLNHCGELGKVNPAIIAKAMGLLAKQCVEKIDNVRAHASEVFATIIHQKNPDMDHIPRLPDLQRLFPVDFCLSVTWRFTSATFPKFVEMLTLEEYTYYVLEGFVVSGGSLSDSVMKDANGAITNYLVAAGAMGDMELARIGGVLIKIFENNEKNDRVSIPLMKFVTQLLQSGIFLPLLSEGSDSFGLQVMELVKNEVLKCGRVEKIIMAIELLCEMLQGSQAVVKAAMKRLVVYLAHQYPRIRMVSSQKIYEALLTYGADELAPPETVEQVMALLSETPWDTNSPDIRPTRNKICGLLNIPHPTVLKPPSA